MSNPIISKDRYTVEEMLQQIGVAKKQDLRGLAILAQGAPRDLLSSLADPDFSQAKVLLGGGVKSLEIQQPIDLTCLTKKADYCPVSNLKHQDVQIHPEGTHQTRGQVSSKRNFGRVGKQDSILSTAALAAYPLDKLEEQRDAVVYTSGTPEGFSTRLRELTTRKCKSEGKPTRIAQKLAKLLPTTMLPDWHDVDELFAQVKLTASSGAGAPYWVPTKDAMASMLGTVLPLVLEHIEAGTLGTLAKEQPELFLTELKNKTDRYAMDEVRRKTRPYVCQGKHFSFLFSCLTQPMCHSLETWDKTDTLNAYGWSMAKGGINRVYERVKKLQELAIAKKTTQFKVGLYGDDAKLFMCTKDGSVYAVDPDFKQMDGSVDFDTIQGVVRWMSNMYTEQHGESPLWDRVLSLMAIMASHPDMIVEGTTIYKKQKDGLLSGAVGTTLFDTAKSALAYADLIDQLETDNSMFFDAKRVTAWMLEKHGLVVKPGTWEPEQLDMQPRNNEYWTTNKFLGMRFLWREYEIEGQIKNTLVPSLFEDEWLELLLHPRDDINSVGKALSDVAKQRQSLDRARGYLVTGAVFDPTIRDVLFKAIDMVPAAAVLMSVAAGDGRGEGPELFQVVGEDFSYPTSEGVPNLRWITMLYSSDPPHKDDWKPIFPTLHEKIMLSRAPWKTRLRNLMLAKSLPADPMVEIMVMDTKPSVAIDFPTPSTSFAKKGVEKTMPNLGTARVKLQSRADYVEALINRDSFLPIAQQKPVATHNKKPVPTPRTILPVVSIPEGTLVVDREDTEAFNITVETDIRELTKLTLPLTATQPDLAWVNYIAQREGMKFVFYTEVTRYQQVTDSQPIPIKRVTGYLQSPVGDRTRIASAETSAKAEIVRQAIIYKIYAVMVELHAHNIIRSRNVSKKVPGIIFNIPYTYTRTESVQVEALARAMVPGDVWAYDNEVDERLNRSEQLHSTELQLLNQVKVAEGLLQKFQQAVSKIQKDRHAEQQKYEQERPKTSSQKAKAATKNRGRATQSSKSANGGPRNW
ncbi:RdRp [Sanxia permutotetra-like virus 1]|uniref:RdRp n=1 Tax=Sanxia permutotetra-like virus 1 TaxID=1923365 RepID=UPI00090B3C46|nr:RdRp [Sanxia permutotetra-like virus 1]APG76951.1 RdRp [Sanxia permutotetra-like virus 1]